MAYLHFRQIKWVIEIILFLIIFDIYNFQSYDFVFFNQVVRDEISLDFSPIVKSLFELTE